MKTLQYANVRVREHTRTLFKPHEKRYQTLWNLNGVVLRGDHLFI